MSRTVLAAPILLALALGACERGHYATRDHVVTEESAGAEAQTVSTSETAASAQTDGAQAQTTALSTDGAQALSTDGAQALSTDGAQAQTTDGAQAQTTDGALAQTTDGASAENSDAQTGAANDGGTRGHAPEEDMARARAQAPTAVTIRVHTTSGPVTRAVAERALAMQRMRIDQCYRTVVGSSSAGSMRASIHVESSGASRAELETMTPELDRVLPCVDAALERTPFPASSDGRPTHIVAEIARTP